MFYNQPSDQDAKRTITLSRKDLLAARRLLRMLVGHDRKPSDDLLQDHSPAKAIEERDRTQLVARAKAEFRNRRRRGRVFEKSMFGEAAWDMLLALYVVDVAGARQTVGNLLHSSGTPPSTAKRWLDFLSENGLVRRDAHPTDRRTAFVSLTEQARDKLDRHFSETVAATV